MPFGANSGRSRVSVACTTVASVTNRCAIASPATWASSSNGGSSLSISAAIASGIASRHVVWPAATPSFFRKGVPEYPVAAAFAIAPPPVRTRA